MKLYGSFLGMSAFSTRVFFRITRPRGLVTLLGGIGILALVFSAVSPDDDLSQQDAICPPIPAVRMFSHTAAAPKRVSAGFSVDARVIAEDPIFVLKTGHSFVTDQRLDVEAHFAAPTLIHSPPNLFLLCS